MDPVTMITSALAAGAVSALKETAGTSIKDAYQGLVSLVRRKFDQDKQAQQILESHAEDPDTWQKPLEKNIQESGVAKDQDVLAAAQRLLDLLQAHDPTSKYLVNIQGDVQGFVQGDKANVKMTFTQEASKKKDKK